MYTKGEWQIGRTGSKRFEILTDKRIAIVDTFDDAQLIHAAPEMYEALKLYQSHQEGTHGHYCWQCAEAINKALAKAEGKEA